MTTIPDSIKAQLDADWAIGTGGVEPTYYVSEDFRTNPPLGKDGLWIPTETLKTDVRPVNDTYANHNHTIDLIVNTITSEDRLKELADEVVRILNATAITDMTYQRITNRKRVSGDYNGIWVYQEIITVDMREQMATSAAAYGAGAGTNLDDLLMYGSAHAAWVPCIFELPSIASSVIGTGANLTNVAALDPVVAYVCPLPTVKGSLKLYTSGVRVGISDADADDFLNQVVVRGTTYAGITNLNNDTTDYTSAQRVEQTFVAVDCSTYDQLLVSLVLACATGGELDINYVTLRCYYA